jgi:DNA-binding SARP family transcriptional activator/predicted ATPase
LAVTEGLSISVLGPPVIEVEGRLLDVDTRKATALLVYLAVTGRPASRDSLAALLWPEAGPDRARATLRRTLSTLRSALRGRWLETEGETVRLARDGVETDVTELRRLLEECSTHRHPRSEACPRCLEPLEAAVALDRGPFLAGFGLRDSVEFDDWQQAVAGEIRRDVGTALERLVDLLARSGELPRAITYAERRLASDPLNESAHGQLIRLLAEAGNRSAALEQYRECVRILDRELGVRPLDETTALFRAILEGTWSAPAGITPPPYRPAAGKEYPLTGRDRELAVLLDAYRSAAPHGRFAVITGEAGIGKSRLGDELLATVEGEGGLAIGVRGFREESELAYAVAAEIARRALAHLAAGNETPWWSKEVGRIVPELGTAPEGTIDSAAAQARLYEAIGELLAQAAGEERPALLFVDDLHWADESSLGLLGYLVHRLENRPLLVVGSWRPEEVSAGHPVRRLLVDAQRSRTAIGVTPARLGKGHIRSLAASAGYDETLADRLYAESGGLPLFVVEYLDALDRHDDPAGEWPLPLGVRDLVESRLATLGELAAQVVSAASVLGRSFEAATVRDTSGRTDDEALQALEELVAAGVLVEGAEGLFDFRQEQARHVVYEQMTLARRRLLHSRAASALATGARRDTVAALVAHHYELAGEHLAAAGNYRAAADRERLLYANAEALAHYRAAIALGHPGAAELHVACGDLETLAGDYAGALASYETAAALATVDERPEIARRRGLVHLRRGEWELADAAFAEALDGITPAGAAHVLADLALVAHRRGAEADAHTAADRALAASAEVGDPAALAQAHNIAGILATSRGDVTEAVTHLETSLELAGEPGDPAAQVAARNNLALAVAASGDDERALELARSALELCATVGDRHREAAIRNTLADLHHRAGREEESMDELKRAVAIFAEIGEPGELEPEIWKLSAW